MSDARSTSRSWPARAVLLLSAVALFLGTLSIYARDTFFDSTEMGHLATEAMDQAEVRQAATTQIVDELVAYDPELLQARPILELIVDGVLQSAVFDEILQFAVEDLHQTLFTGASDTASLQLVDLVLAIKVSLGKLDPELATLIPDDVTNSLVTVRADPALVDGLQLANTVEFLAFVLPVVALAGAALVVWWASDRRRSLITLGRSAISVGILLVVTLAVARTAFLRRFDTEQSQAAGRAVWEVYTRGAVELGLIVVAAGVVLAFIAAIGFHRTHTVGRLRAMAETFEPPETKGARAIWGSIAIVAGLLLVIQWELALRLAVTLAGATLALNGAAEVLASLGVTPTEARSVPVAGNDRSGRRSWALGGFVAVGLLALVLYSVERSNPGDATTASHPGCNGSVLLCDRRVDQVVFATTHNSMAAANDGFTGGYQTEGIIPQLDDGYRGFLVDVYFGLEQDNLVVTDRAPVTEEERTQLVADVGESTVRSAEALRAANEDVGGTRDVFLCHSFCEIGAVNMTEEFTRIRKWLDDHPREVLLFVLQDEGPQDVDIERVFDDSGLLDFVHTQKVDEPWPTLGEMIESGRRIWVSAEHDPGDLAWYHDAFTHVQDTPYSQPTVEDFSCELLRGRPDSPLFLVNHWLSPARATSADLANSRLVLEDRLAECDQVRGLVPNMVAVDFSDRGDVLAVVDDLNGLTLD